MPSASSSLILPVVLCALLERDHPAREEGEAFIRASFRRHYGAHLAALPPCLFALYGPEAQLLAAAGLRRAKDGPLFLEQYLNEPVEDALAGRIGMAVDRSAIMEVGSLAVVNPGYGRVLIQTLTGFLFHRRFAWVAFTAVPMLRNSFRRLGLDPRPLCLADRRRLAADGSDWGRYYDSRPMVMYGNVPGGYRFLYEKRRSLPAAAPARTLGRVRA